MPIDFYFEPSSPPCRSVHLVAAALGVEAELNFKSIFSSNDNTTLESLKIFNPQKTIPTIVDDGFALWESRAICRYLIAKYGENSTLYPQDLKSRALVDQRLDFDLGTLYSRFADYAYPVMFRDAPADEAKFKKLDEALKFLDTFLEGQMYAVGAELTLADLSLVVTVSTIDAAGISLAPYSNVTKWYKLVKSTAPKYDEANGAGAELIRAMVAKNSAKFNIN